MPFKVGVIGAGATGLVACKELRDAGHDPICFEMLDSLGGAFYTAYPGCVLTTSSVLTPYSDYFRDTKPGRFWTAKEYVEYMNDYADHFDIRKFIHFSSPIIGCERLGPGQGWLLEIRHEEEEMTKRYKVDKLMVCTGTNQTYNLPHWPGDESFTGEIVHSSEFQGADSQQITGKRILVVGSGESAADISHIVSAKGRAAKTYVSVRSSPAHIIPRLAGPPASPHIADLDTTRYTHSIARILTYPTMYMRWIRRRAHGKGSGNQVLYKMAQINMKYKTSVFNTFTNKSAGIIKAIVENDVKIVPDIEKIDNSTVIFKDGQKLDFDVIVCCTGFKSEFKWLEPSLPKDQMDCVKYVRHLYRHCFHPDLGLDFMMCGYARPGVGNTSTLSELQARWYCLLLDGKMKLPSKAEMERNCCERIKFMEHQYGHSAKRIVPLVDFLDYLDELSGDMGVRPEIDFFKDFGFSLRTMKVPINGAQFRLRGPGAKPELAKNHLLTMPTSNFIDTALCLLGNIMVYSVLPPLPFMKDPLRPIGAIGDFCHKTRRRVRILLTLIFMAWYYKNNTEKVQQNLQWLFTLASSKIAALSS